MRKQTVLTFLVGGILLAFVSGCIDATSLIALNPDGSGTLTETMYLGQAAQNMAMMMGGKGGGQAKNPLDKPLDLAKYRQRAKMLGKGVTFLDAKKVARKSNGSRGVSVRYKFKNIADLQLSTKPGGSAGGMGASQMRPQPGKKAEPKMHFGFTRQGGVSTLTLEMPDNPATEIKMPPQQQLNMMKFMLAGARVRLLLKVKGNIIGGNAVHVLKNRKTGKKNRVILADMKIGDLFANPKSLAALQALSGVHEQKAVLKKLDALPEMSIQTEPKIKISFK